MGLVVQWGGQLGGVGSWVGEVGSWMGLVVQWGGQLGGVGSWVGWAVGWGGQLDGVGSWVGWAVGWGGQLGGVGSWMGLVVGWGEQLDGVGSWMGLAFKQGWQLDGYFDDSVMTRWGYRVGRRSVFGSLGELASAYHFLFLSYPLSPIDQRLKGPGWFPFQRLPAASEAQAVLPEGCHSCRPGAMGQERVPDVQEGKRVHQHALEQAEGTFICWFSVPHSRTCWIA